MQRRRPMPPARIALGAWLVWVLAVGVPGQPTAREEGPDPWAALPELLARIRAPSFPHRDCPLPEHGGIQAAIEDCHRAGGGRVVVPAGEFETGPLVLKSNVDLHLAAGATLRFSRDPKDYLPVVHTRWEGVELMNYSPLVYAYGQENVAITGEGTLDGQAGPDHWWPWKTGERGHPSQKADRDRLFQQGEEGVPVERRVYGAGHYLRPSFIQPYRCRNVLIEGITIRNAPMWAIHPVLSENVTVRRVRVVSLGPNNDGCNPESARDVVIEDSLFDNGDDCIAIKSGRNADGRRLAAPSENVVIRGCRMRAGHGGVTIGSEVSGGVRNVFAERCTMSSPDLERGLRIKTNAMRGGVVEKVYVRDVEIGEVTGAAIDVDMLYEEGERGLFPPVVRDIRVERLRVARAGWALHVRALPGSPLQGLLVKDSVFSDVRRGSFLDGVRGLRLDGVTLGGTKP